MNKDNNNNDNSPTVNNVVNFPKKRRINKNEGPTITQEADLYKFKFIKLFMGQLIGLNSNMLSSADFNPSHPKWNEDIQLFILVMEGMLARNVNLKHTIHPVMDEMIRRLGGNESSGQETSKSTAANDNEPSDDAAKDNIPSSSDKDTAVDPLDILGTEMPSEFITESFVPEDEPPEPPKIA